MSRATDANGTPIAVPTPHGTGARGWLRVLRVKNHRTGAELHLHGAVVKDGLVQQCYFFGKEWVDGKNMDASTFGPLASQLPPLPTLPPPVVKCHRTGKTGSFWYRFNTEVSGLLSFEGPHYVLENRVTGEPLLKTTK